MRAVKRRRDLSNGHSQNVALLIECVDYVLHLKLDSCQEETEDTRLTAGRFI